MAVDYYLKFAKTIEGESVATGFEKAIQVQSWSWGANQTSSVMEATGSGTGKVQFSDFQLTTVFDKSTPDLLQNMNMGTHFDKVTFSALKAGAKNKPYLTIEFNEAFVTSMSIGAGGEIPSVSLTLSFKSYDMEYKMQDKEGSLQTGSKSGWDLTTNKEQGAK